MQQKLCLWTCVVVLVGALCAGNPFLCGRDGAAAPLSAGASPPATDVPAPPAARAPQAERRDSPMAPLRARRDAGSASDGGVARTLHRAEPLDAIVPVSLAAHVPADAAACPDPAVAPFVERTEHDVRRGTVWVLRDGSRLVRNPRRGAGQPVLVAE